MFLNLNTAKCLRITFISSAKYCHRLGLFTLKLNRCFFNYQYYYLKGQEPEVTCVDYMYRLCLDYVFYREPISLKSSAEKESKAVVSKLEPLQVLDTLPLDHILKDIPISQVFSSDHFPLLVKFAIKHITVT